LSRCPGFQVGEIDVEGDLVVAIQIVPAQGGELIDILRDLDFSGSPSKDGWDCRRTCGVDEVASAFSGA
jgi:hypothetical protein